MDADSSPASLVSPTGINIIVAGTRLEDAKFDLTDISFLLVELLREAFKDGFTVTIRGEPRTVFAEVIATCTDGRGAEKLHLLPNGSGSYHGCPTCWTRGVYVKSEKGKWKMLYPGNSLIQSSDRRRSEL
jgi:hypothetical protein